MAARTLRWVTAGVGSLAVGGLIAWAIWSRHPGSAVLSVVILIGSVASQRNQDLSRRWYLLSAVLVVAGISAAAVSGINAIKLTGLIVLVAGIGVAIQVLSIRANHVPVDVEATPDSGPSG